MKRQGEKVRRLALRVALMLWCVAAGAQTAGRQLHWEALDVEAHLNADGVLDVTERHTMVFTGDWNGGERVFNVRPRQKLEFLGLERIDAKTGSPHPLQETSVPDSVDEFTWSDSRTLRWRSRLPSDPPFANTRLTYGVRYKLSGILLRDDEQYRIDHDFAFPDRPGPIARFTLRLDLDPAWQPLGEFQSRYSAGPLERGRGFVLNIPLRNTGSIVPAAIDSGRPREIAVAVMVILGWFTLLMLAFIIRERSLGRFAPLDPSAVDSKWIESNVLAYPAEVVGAAWDGRVSTAEVVALIARMTAEGKLESKIESRDSIKLILKVDRRELRGHEWALVDGLFFDQRTETSTKQVKQHYKNEGFNPAKVIEPALEEHVKKMLPPGDAPAGRLFNVAMFLVAVALFVWSAFSAPILAGPSIGIVVFSFFLGAILQIPGWLFRSRVDWGLKAAALLMLPALVLSLGAAPFLWFVVGTGGIELPWTMVGGLTVLVLCISSGAINGMKSRQSREAIALRKRLTTGRSFFLQELEKPRPNLRDSWYPWLLAFGIGKQVDVWSSHHRTTKTSDSTWDYTSTSTGSTSTHSSTPSGWSGGGGLSGGAGASGAWAAAAAGMAAGVAAPSSDSSSSGGSSSSSSGSSGGGGGGGW